MRMRIVLQNTLKFKRLLVPWSHPLHKLWGSSSDMRYEIWQMAEVGVGVEVEVEANYIDIYCSKHT